MIEYSIVIRTIGKAGEKYQALLESIKNLSVQPKEILVVLPEGYDLPKQKLGTERFVFCKKGMLNQRIVGGNIATAEYILFLDDDVEFESSFIEKMSAPIEKGICEVTVPPQFSMLPPENGVRRWIPMLQLAACPMKFHKNYYTRILRSGGWSYNRFDPEQVEPYLYAHSAAGIGFFTRRDTFNNINLQEELWLDNMQYPLGEDQVTFYKYWVKQYKIVCVTDARFTHLDAGGSSEGRDVAAAYGMGYFKRIFWKRFIYNEDQGVTRFLDVLAYFWGVFMTKFISMLEIPVIREKKAELIAMRQGIKDAKKFMKSDEFRKIPKAGGRQ